MNELEYFTKNFEIHYEIYLFVATIIMIHVSIIVFPKSRRTKKFWLLLDYIYYGIGLLGLISLYATARINIANYEKGYLPQSIDALLYTAKDYSQSAENYLNAFTPDDIKKITPQKYDKFKTYYKAVNKNLTVPFKKENWLQILELNDPYMAESNKNNLCLLVGQTQKYCNKVWIEPYELIKYKISYAKNRLATIQKLNSNDHKNDNEIFLSLLAPFLLAFALGIRISKITAELVGYREEE